MIKSQFSIKRKLGTDTLVKSDMNHGAPCLRALIGDPSLALLTIDLVYLLNPKDCDFTIRRHEDIESNQAIANKIANTKRELICYEQQ